MSVGMFSTAERDGARADLNSLLGIDENDVDAGETQVAITRVTDRGAINAISGKYDSPTTSSIYSGAAIVAPLVFRRDRQEIIAGEAIRIRQYRVLLPWDAGDIYINDDCEFTACSDPDLVGRTMKVSDVMYNSNSAGRRITLTDITDDSDADC